MKLKSSILIAAALSTLNIAANAAVVLSEDFNASSVNPTATTFTTDLTWNYSDSTGTTVNANESRLFNPGGAGSGENTHGWISSLTAGNTYQQIQTNQTFTGVPTLTVGQYYLFTLNFFASAQTSTAANDVNSYVQFISAGNSFTGFTGANGGAAAPTFSAQTLTDSNAAADTINTTFIAQGGAGGYNLPRSYTATWQSSDINLGESYSLILGRTTNVAGSAFILYDNITLDVAVIPEPNIAALLGGFGILALLRRRR